MGRRDNLKILTTAILVVLLLSSFIFAFIYRNEIYQKLQTIGKNKDVEVFDREIAKSPETIPPPKEIVENGEGRDSVDDRTKLPELPSLDDMEPDAERPRSVSVASSTKAKETKDSGSRLKEKLDQVEEQFLPKEKLNSTSPSTSKESMKKQTETKTESIPKEKVESIVETTKPLSKSKKLKVQKKSSAVSSKSNYQNVKTSFSSKSKTKADSKDTSLRQKSTQKQNGSNSHLEVRMNEVEQKLNSQNDRNEKRFLEIERRIDSLEKVLAK
ncbi:hypothetical protein [Leptospira biflexa]|uniref:hypothetical protein n=1 Tax=Leptospira biflexa TaxID=172 RepID=UPI001082342A|nr:hypothetical protein [Leptospira biflexa]TGM34127.1 hypothetical protein EHQ89_13050 [Leptospira biflexa]TGM40215.1 hypothetical protein EHQ80_03285 [Leptospira biflexa]